jgi:hypothetical protein
MTDKPQPKKRGRPPKQLDQTTRRPRPPIVITDEVLRQAEELAGYGLSHAQIAAVLGMAERTLREKKSENEAFDAALGRGRAKAAGIIGKALFLRAKDGDVAAIRWWEMTRQGRSERQHTDAKVEVVNDPVADARLARIVEETAARLATETYPRIEPPLNA